MTIPTPSHTREVTNQRNPECRRMVVNSDFIGVDKCEERRVSTRRESERFNKDAWEKRCYDNLGPGWL